MGHCTVLALLEASPLGLSHESLARNHYFEAVNFWRMAKAEMKCFFGGAVPLAQ